MSKVVKVRKATKVNGKRFAANTVVRLPESLAKALLAKGGAYPVDVGELRKTEAREASKRKAKAEAKGTAKKDKK